VVRIDPHRMAVAVDVARAGIEERLPAVVRNRGAEVEDVDALVVGGVDTHLSEVEAARNQIADAHPMRAAIVGPKHAAAAAAHPFERDRPADIRLDYGVEDLR